MYFKIMADESVKDSGNSTFLQKGQLCKLKPAEKISFGIYFPQDKNAKLVPFLSMLQVMLVV